VSTSPACCLVDRGRDNAWEILDEDKTKIYSLISRFSFFKKALLGGCPTLLMISYYLSTKENKSSLPSAFQSVLL
jgi:hypothetical protein